MSDLSAVSGAVARGPKSCKWCGNINLHPEDPWCPDCRFRLASMIVSRHVALHDRPGGYDDVLERLQVLDRWRHSDPLWRTGLADKYPDAQKSPLNRFEDAEDVTELIHQVIGAGSMCWENLSGAGVFDSTEAAKIGSDAVARLSELGYIPMIARGEAKTRRKL